MKRFLALVLLAVVYLKGYSAVCYSTGNGAFNNTATWSCPGGPSCGDTIIIQAGHTVTVTTQQNFAQNPCNTPMLMIVHGTLKFETGNRIDFPCGSQVFVTSTGSLVPGGGSGNSDWIKICGDVYWNTAAGSVAGPVCYPPGCSSLPIELIAFTGNLEVKVVFLNWKTSREVNNSHFIIEKSHDGSNFKSIGKINSKGISGNSSGSLSYDYIDQDLKHPLYYYRLKQVDLDGSAQYSKTISVKIYSPEFKVYPNPNTGVFSIDVPTPEVNQKVDLQIVDAVGKLLHEYTYNVINDNITGAKIEVIPPSPLSKGSYICIISYKGEAYRLKLIVN